jgi:hypothetical protein
MARFCGGSVGRQEGEGPCPWAGAVVGPNRTEFRPSEARQALRNIVAVVVVIVVVLIVTPPLSALCLWLTFSFGVPSPPRCLESLPSLHRCSLPPRPLIPGVSCFRACLLSPPPLSFLSPFLFPLSVFVVTPWRECARGVAFAPGGCCCSLLFSCPNSSKLVRAGLRI